MKEKEKEKPSKKTKKEESKDDDSDADRRKKKKLSGKVDKPFPLLTHLTHQLNFCYPVHIQPLGEGEGEGKAIEEIQEGRE